MMTATEIFKLFLRKGLEPNERLAFVTELRVRIRCNDRVLCRSYYYGEKELTPYEIENIFIEKLVRSSWCTNNTLGRYGSSSCTSLSSVMRYLLYYIPTIVGTAKKKNKYLERINADIPQKQGYKKYWESRLIKKWHEFLKQNVRNYDRYVYSTSNMKYNLYDNSLQQS